MGNRVKTAFTGQGGLFRFYHHLAGFDQVGDVLSDQAGNPRLAESPHDWNIQALSHFLAGCRDGIGFKLGKLVRCPRLVMCLHLLG
jgi:hypothetical protein